MPQPSFPICKFLTKTPASPNPYASGSPLVDLLLRHDHWTGELGKPIHLRYSITSDQLPHANFIAAFFDFIQSKWKVIPDFDEFPSEDNGSNRQGNYDSWVKWQFTAPLDALKTMLDNPKTPYPSSLIEEGLSREMLTVILEHIYDVPTLKRRYPDFMEKITASGMEKWEEKSEEGETLPEHIPLMKNVLSQFLTHYTRYVGISFEHVTDGTQHVTLDTDYLTTELMLEKCLELYKVDQEPLTQHCHKLHDVTSPFLRFYEGMDMIWWEDHCIFSALVDGIFTAPAKFMPDSLESLELESFPILFHAVHHFFIDHPADSVLFLEKTIDRENGNTLYEKAEVALEINQPTFSQWEHPFSLCSSTMVIGGASHPVSRALKKIEDCILEGETHYPITMMPLDLKALHHLYGRSCEKEPVTFILDGKTSPDLFDFPLQEKAIFTLFSCQESTLDLSFYEGTTPVELDFSAGVPHWNHVGNHWFLWGHGAKVERVILPPLAEVSILEGDVSALALEVIESPLE